MGLRGLGFRVVGLGVQEFRVWDLGFGNWGLGFRKSRRHRTVGISVIHLEAQVRTWAVQGFGTAERATVR